MSYSLSKKVKSRVKSFLKKTWKNRFIRYSSRKTRRQDYILKPYVKVSVAEQHLTNHCKACILPFFEAHQQLSLWNRNHITTNHNYSQIEEETKMSAMWDSTPQSYYFIFKKANYIKGSFSKTIQNSRSAQSKACYYTDMLTVLLGSMCILISCHLCVIKISNFYQFVCCNQYTNTAICDF